MAKTTDKDPQQKRVYRMERLELSGHLRHRMALCELRKMSRALCRRYRVPVANVVARNERGFWATYDYETGLVCLNPQGGRNAATLAHELAHHVAYVLHPGAQDHGPTFMKYYVEMLDSLRLVPAAGMRAIARKYRVAIA